VSSPPVRYEVDDGVAWVTLDRPEAANALSEAVRRGLWEATRRFNDDRSAAVLVLTGSGERAFCAGADLKEMSSSGLEIPPPDFLPHFGRNVDVEKPTIAAVNGVAYAGGFLLAQMCDLCLAAESARFAITEPKVGRGAPWAAPLPWLVPPRIALELLLTAEPITARRAYDVGLVNEVVAGVELRARAQEVARRIADNAPLSVRAGKRMVYAAARAVRTAVFDEAEEIWAPVYRSGDAQEGPRAFTEKRPPRWEGR